MNSQKTNKGFTIIEVVLVLAIAGLIFLMVFLALPALQRSQRDTQRKDDLGRITAALTTYKSNTGGKLPWTVFTSNGVVSAYNPTTFVADYLTSGGSSFNDPTTGSAYALDNTNTAPPNVPTPDADSQIMIYKTSGTDCTTATALSAGTRYVVKMYQENGGSVCQNL